ncbi:hypothetical protein [Kineococcus aurantiacus]|uniref:hypothetical protein n=1 Tax=Kineococcus aurantiacus TaxID=37633 RepID=UPI001C53944A|nr:hypothetical protein [Kineococcus aurantiacus]
MGDVERAAALRRAVQDHVAAGAVVQHASAHQAVLTCREATAHRRHALAAVCTLGAWLPFWAALSIARSRRRHSVQLVVDACGVVTSRTLGPAPRPGSR